jgi:hypothetical protein
VEELAFLAAVGAASPRVTYRTIGQSTEGRALHLVRVGFPRAPSNDAIAEGASVLIIATQHGNEPAGREMALALLRDLAFTRDAALVEQLAGTTVLFIPTANPDGRVADRRGNAPGVDINRDHIGLATPEARAMAAVMRDFRPDLVVDAHERPGAVGQDMQLLWPRNLNVDDAVWALSREMVRDYVWKDLEQRSYTVGLYGPDPGPPGAAGDENETILRNTAGLRHHLSMLAESAGGESARSRVEAHLAAAHAALRFHRERLQDVARAVTDAPARKEAAGAARSEPFFLSGADYRPPAPGEVLDPPPCGYRLTAPQAQALAPQIELFPLRVEATGGGGAFLPMAQPLKTVIPLLADARARASVVDGEALESAAECAALPAMTAAGAPPPS